MIHSDTYKHLEDPTTVGGLSIVQWVLLAGTAVGAVLFGLYLSPLPPEPTITLTIFVAGAPTAISYGLQGADGRVSDMVVALWRWTVAAKHHLPGAGVVEAGYVVQRPVEQARVARTAEDVQADRAQREDAWDR